MKQPNMLAGALLLLVAALAWGGMFPVAKAALTGLDAFYMTSIRYGVAALILLAILAVVEGGDALRLEGRGSDVFLFGTLGFAGFSLLAFVGLTYSRPEHAAIIMALMPLITALVNWGWKGTFPGRFTLACIGAALLGVLLVISKGEPQRLAGSGVGFGDLLIFLGAVCWVLYTLGAGRARGWSPLRYTALSCALGTVSIFIATAVATGVGFVHIPSLALIGSVKYELGYMILIGAVLAVLSWNGGVKALGALNGVLFINLVPVTTFAIGVMQGRHFEGVEFTGAAMTLSALIANNLHARRGLRTRLPAPGSTSG